MTTQTATLLTQTAAMYIEMPEPDAHLLRNVRWGAIDAFPTPAYWLYQVMNRRLTGASIQYKLGRTLVEEVGACLLGGHGIPAAVGLAAYKRLRERGAFTRQRNSAEDFEAWLREPLFLKGRPVRYRFASQKARYLAAAIPAIPTEPNFESGRHLRDWLTTLPGIGPKTASWITRNWMDADDVAILDIHIMRIGQFMGLFPRELTVDRHYGELESLFVELSAALGVRTSELDALVWHEMATSPATTRYVIKALSDCSASFPRTQHKTPESRGPFIQGSR